MRCVRTRAGTGLTTASGEDRGQGKQRGKRLPSRLVDHGEAFMRIREIVANSIMLVKLLGNAANSA